MTFICKKATICKLFQHTSLKGAKILIAYFTYLQEFIVSSHKKKHFEETLTILFSSQSWLTQSVILHICCRAEHLFDIAALALTI